MVGRMPDFFVLAHQESDARILHGTLSRHPQVFMAPRREPGFFASDLRFRGRGRQGDGSPHTLEGYRGLFAEAPAAQRIGEASSYYLRSRVAAERIAELAPDARVVVVLRDPISFLASFHSELVEEGIERQRDLRKAMALERSRRQGKRLRRSSRQPQALMYSEHVRYVAQVRRFHEAFTPERVLVTIDDDLLGHSDDALHELLRFIDVDEGVSLNSTTDPAPDASGSHVRGQGAGFWRRPARRGQQTLDSELTRALRLRLKPEVEALSELLGRDLVARWGYDETVSLSPTWIAPPSSTSP